MKVKGEKGVSTKKSYKNKYYLSIVLEDGQESLVR